MQAWEGGSNGIAESVCNESLPGIFDTGTREHEALLGRPSRSAWK